MKNTLLSEFETILRREGASRRSVILLVSFDNKVQIDMYRTEDDLSADKNFGCGNGTTLEAAISDAVELT